MWWNGGRLEVGEVVLVCVPDFVEVDVLATVYQNGLLVAAFAANGNVDSAKTMYLNNVNSHVWSNWLMTDWLMNNAVLNSSRV